MWSSSGSTPDATLPARIWPMTHRCASFRAWAPRGTPPSVDADGFRVRPRSSHVGQIVTLGEARDRPCLVLLGEPGLGKSTAIAEEAMELRRDCAADAVLTIDLGSYGSDDQLSRDLFESGTWQTWLAGAHVLHLFADALDEARIRMGAVTRILERGLSAVPAASLSRLRFRVASRSAEWPQRFERVLRSRWPEDDVGVLHLLPFGRGDAVRMAEAAGVDAEAFFASARQRGLVALCTRPLTLGLMLRAFRRAHGRLDDQASSFELGCLLMCDEPDSERRSDRLLRGTLTAARRLEVAARIAAATLCSGGGSIWADIDPTDSSDDDVHYRDLVGGTEVARSSTLQDRFPVDEDAVLETLGTALFISTDASRRVRFAHRSLAEYLAARYLAQHAATVQLVSVVSDPTDPARRVFPQLDNLAGWLAHFDEGFRAVIVEADAEALLRSDVYLVEPAQQTQMLDAVVAGVERRTIDPLDERIARGVARLDSPALVPLLRAILPDRSLRSATRTLALDVAARLATEDLVEVLLDVAFCDDEDVALRLRAVLVIETIAPAALARARLAAVLSTPITDAETERLVGATLRVLGPENVSFVEAFRRLDGRWVGHEPHGELAVAIRERIGSEVGEVNLAPIMDWTARALTRWRPVGYVLTLADALLERVWPDRDRPDLQRRIDAVVLIRIRWQADWYGGDPPLPLDEDERRAFVGRLVPRVVDTSLEWISEDRLDGGVSATQLARAGPELLTPEDLPWLGSRLAEVAGHPEEAAWAQVAAAVAYAAADVDDALAKLAEARASSAELNRLLAEEAADARQREAWERRRRARDLATGVDASAPRPMNDYADIWRRYAADPDDTIARLLADVAEQAAAGEPYVPATIVLLRLWDERIAENVATAVEERRFPGGQTIALLGSGAKLEEPRFWAIAERWIEEATDDEDDESFFYSLEAALIYLLYAHDAGWERIRPKMSAFELWGRSLVRALHGHHQWRPLTAELLEPQLADLYRWLRTHHWRDDSYTSGGYATFHQWSQQILDRLAAEGSDASVVALADLRTEWPEDEALERAAIAAARAHRSAAWRPPLPSEILAMTSNSQVRILTGSMHLLEVVRESLARAQAALHGRPPAARDLWDTHAGMPKSESEIADWVARWLRDDLSRNFVLVNREVEVERRSNGGLGERPDILVEALTENGARLPLRLPIEVKGSWNRRLRRDLREQLVRRYMGAHSDHGLYLVAWFTRDQWVSSDRRRSASRRSVDALRAEMEAASSAIRAETDLVAAAVVLDASLPS